MKNFFGYLILMLGLSGVLNAQNREIYFEKGSFAEALSKAGQEKKLLFMDCYTEWCGPCKLLAKNVFTRDSVADFFNANFINFSIDMEKGEGRELQKRFQVSAYPTLLLINGEGEEVFRSVGGCSANELLACFRNALEPENTIAGMEKKFAAGNRNPEFVAKYWKTLQDARLFETLRKSTTIYFDGMSMAEICQEPYWGLYDTFVDIDDSLYHLMIQHIQELKKLKGEELIENKLSDAYDLALLGRIPNVGHSREQLKQYEEDIEQIGFKDTVKLFYLRVYLKLAKMKVERQYDACLDFMEKDLKTFSLQERQRILVTLIMLADGATPEQRKRGNEVLYRELMAIVKERGKELSDPEQQIFGYIQYKLEE